MITVHDLCIIWPVCSVVNLGAMLWLATKRDFENHDAFTAMLVVFLGPFSWLTGALVFVSLFLFVDLPRHLRRRDDT